MQVEDYWLDEFLKFVRNGDRKAAHIILEKLQNIARKLINTDFEILKSTAKTWDDIAEEAFLRLINNYKDKNPEDFIQKDGGSSFIKIMFKTIKNLFLNEIRKIKRWEEIKAEQDNQISPNIVLDPILKNVIAECLKKLKEEDEFKWLVLLAWHHVRFSSDYFLSLNPYISVDILLSNGTETSKIINIVEQMGIVHSEKLKMSSETIDKTRREQNENTIKSDIRRAKGILINCLKKKGVFSSSDAI